MRATQRLYVYLTTAQLPALKTGAGAPEPPPIGHKSHLNHLRILNDRPRTATEVQNFFGALDMATPWIRNKFDVRDMEIPDEDEDTGESLTLPSCSNIFDIPRTWHRPIGDLFKLGDWLEDLPLVTVSRLLHLVEERTLQWRFVRVHDRDWDRDLFQYFLWTRVTDGASTPRAARMDEENDSEKSVVVAFQPPWILSREDMKNFATSEFPQRSLDMNKSQLTSRERLWGKMWDVCVAKDAYFFVLTSYEQWVFGCWSRNYTTACISDVFEWNAHGPSVTECLTFWIASAMGVVSTKGDNNGTKVIKIPKISSNRIPVVVKPPPFDETTFEAPAASDSHWTGKSADTGSETSFLTTQTHFVSDSGVYPTSAPINRPQKADNEAIRRWALGL
ncbi:hypothetical protein CYLTODRAFT_81489 [Cylindrobasidium torrendii FP15055 ss-10]|uniref:Uncharacterized protein n=1 Tax=Cylindrobasidium torrendii FP15055 ss-10 TaxID=1314674 RepID=A0A0D7B415_9AGAR|nr:hypothetical protein CYLTODRAFT_81489 [Cylindrobasidium torrendii FP15055 ss-10]